MRRVLRLGIGDAALIDDEDIDNPMLELQARLRRLAAFDQRRIFARFDRRWAARSSPVSQFFSPGFWRRPLTTVSSVHVFCCGTSAGFWLSKSGNVSGTPSF